MLRGLSNTGITSALACSEAVKELGLEKVAIGCLPSVPLKVPPVLGKSKAAKKIITVDGYPFECARKTIEAAGFKIAKSIVLVRDIGMKKKALHIDVDKGLGVEKYISEQLKLKMNKIKHKIEIISGKGGVGKSTVT
ncbi:MAG: putative zinc-binding protein [Candidatus Methanomethylicaceae archaeon]